MLQQLLATLKGFLNAFIIFPEYAQSGAAPARGGARATGRQTLLPRCQYTHTQYTHTAVLQWKLRTGIVHSPLSRCKKKTKNVNNST